MIYFVAYDITNPKRLAKVAKVLENFGIRVQYSFFECEADKKVMNQLCNHILSIIDQKKDKLAVYQICDDCLQKAQTIGSNTIDKPQSFMIL